MKTWFMRCQVCNIGFYLIVLLASLNSLANDNVLELSIEQKRLLLDAHNGFRKKCANGESGFGNGPATAGKMQYVFWDPALEAVAKKRASHCYYSHMGGDEGLRDDFKEFKHLTSFVVPHNSSYQPGENIASYYQNPPASNYPDQIWFNGVQAWYNEGDLWDWDNHFCWDTTCGHWAQVCHDNTRYIGCAVSECENGIAGLDGGYADGGMQLVCNYFPRSSLTKLPFMHGAGVDGCTFCASADSFVCQDNLCVGGKSKHYLSSGQINRSIDQCTDGLERAMFPCTFLEWYYMAPLQIRNLSASMSTTEVVVSWQFANAYNHPLTYSVYRDSLLIGTVQDEAYSDSGNIQDSFTFVDSNTHFDKTYIYKVVATDSNGQSNSGLSVQVSKEGVVDHKENDDIAPTPVANISLNIINYDQEKQLSYVKISWVESFDASELPITYSIYRDDQLIAETYHVWFNDFMDAGQNQKYEIISRDNFGNQSDGVLFQYVPN